MDALIAVLPLSYTDAVVVLGAAVLGITAGVLGAFSVLARRSLVGDALSHAALPGIAIAFLVTGAKDPSTLLVGAGIAGLFGALMIVGVERTSRIRPDAAIGVVLSCFFSLGIVLLTHIAAGGNAQQAGLERYLFGQAAGLLEGDVALMALLAAGAIACVAVGFRGLKTATFDREFAAAAGLRPRAVEIASTALLVVAIVVGLRAVGAILMVAILIIPAVTARQFTNRLAPMLVLAGAIGAGVGIAGALLSARTQVPTGPVIVLTGTAVVLAAILLAPGRGVVWRAARRSRERRRTATSGLLVDLIAVTDDATAPTAAELRTACARPARALARDLRRLTRDGLVVERDGRLHLTATGAVAGRAALEQRALWSAWLEHGTLLEVDDARDADPRDLRGSLGDEAVERLRTLAGLGTPA